MAYRLVYTGKATSLSVDGMSYERGVEHRVNTLPKSIRALRSYGLEVTKLTEEEDKVAPVTAPIVPVAADVDTSYGVMWAGTSKAKNTRYGKFEKNKAVYALSDAVKKSLLDMQGFIKV